MKYSTYGSSTCSQPDAPLHGRIAQKNESTSEKEHETIDPDQFLLLAAEKEVPAAVQWQ